MANVDGYGLNAEFAKKLSAVLAACAAKGFNFKISQGLRTPQKQAEYYCKWAKRSPADIDKAADKMVKDGAPWLASVLKSYRDIPRQAAWLTSALPGGGWHQWGEAADCYCYKAGKMVTDGSDPCYKFYADTAISMGLTAGFYFSKQDSGHLQLSPKDSAASTYTWEHIDEVMQERFGDKDVVALSEGITDDDLLKTSKSAFGPPIAMMATSKYFKDDPALIATQLTPSFAYITSGASGSLRAMAALYNRVGGLLEAFGNKESIDPVAALAVWYVESSGRDFTRGSPIIRFENHIFFDNWGKKHVKEFSEHFKFRDIPKQRHKDHEYRVDTTGPFKKSHVDSQIVEYEAFGLAKKLGGVEAACLSTSWGGPQIMGFNHETLGYPSATELANAFSADERWHVLGFADFCRENSLIDDIQTMNWTNFGKIYNGDGAVYGPKIKAAYDLKSKLLKLPKVPSPGPTTSGLSTAPFLSAANIAVDTSPGAIY